MTGAAPAGDHAPPELTVHLSGGGRRDRTLLLSPAPGGLVHVREWSAEGWLDPVERVTSPDAVYADVERAYRERRRVGVDLPTLEAWLRGLRA